jgi:predicted GIY-YIG superfamily endonuclease
MKPVAITYYVYAILCSNNSVYIGLTKDPAVRWQQHVTGKGGAAWTKRYPPIKMFYCEAVKGGLKKAMARERELKTSTFRNKLRKFLLTGEVSKGLVPNKNYIIKVTV